MHASARNHSTRQLRRMPVAVGVILSACLIAFAAEAVAHLNDDLDYEPIFRLPDNYTDVAVAYLERYSEFVTAREVLEQFLQPLLRAHAQGFEKRKMNLLAFDYIDYHLTGNFFDDFISDGEVQEVLDLEMTIEEAAYLLHKRQLEIFVDIWNYEMAVSLLSAFGVEEDKVNQLPLFEKMLAEPEKNGLTFSNYIAMMEFSDARARLTNMDVSEFDQFRNQRHKEIMQEINDFSEEKIEEIRERVIQQEIVQQDAESGDSVQAQSDAGARASKRTRQVIKPVLQADSVLDEL